MGAQHRYRSPLAGGLERVWVGPDWYGMRLQDWRLVQGRIECPEARPRRPIRVLHQLRVFSAQGSGEYRLQVQMGPLDPGGTFLPGAAAGFWVGGGNDGVHPWKSALVHHRPGKNGGMFCGLEASGQLVFRDNEGGDARGGWGITGPLKKGQFEKFPATAQEGSLPPGWRKEGVLLRLWVRVREGKATLVLSVRPRDEALEGGIEARLEGISAGLVDGSFGLLSHLGTKRVAKKPGRGFWFRRFAASGSLLRKREMQFGPIVGCLYTLSRGVLKLTAQMAPLGPGDPKEARLEIQEPGSGAWKERARAQYDEDACTFRFRVEGMEEGPPLPYRVVYGARVSGEVGSQDFAYEGVLRRRAKSREQFVIASLNCVKHFTGGPLHWDGSALWFPHQDLVAKVESHDPDFLFFAGDQIYEGDLTGIERRPFARARLDYLDKYYRWHLSFRSLTRTRPTVSIPDDHDVFQGNLWGAGGRKARRQDDGGYTMPPRWLKMMERTQTSHLPDPVDPRPIAQGLPVYFTRLEMDGVSFAILEDRKFKDSPTPLVPKGKFRNGWPRAKDFDPAREADVPGAVLLGKRQLAFLEGWAADWSHQAWIKLVLSQTLFSNLATIPEKATGGEVLPGLPVPEPGAWPKGYKLASDADSNGWPPSGRDRALRAWRKAFALHLCGDQHLGSLVHYGVDRFDDAGYGFCAPAVANTWPRRWFPPQAGKDRREGAPPWTGKFLDGFGNHLTVHAVSNPQKTPYKPARLHQRMPGYGILRLDRKTHAITVECWPRAVDPREEGAKQYPGWPLRIPQREEYGRKAWGTLPRIVWEGRGLPVVQVREAKTGTLVYALRSTRKGFIPFVFEPGEYLLRYGDPDGGSWKELRARAKKN